jgi:hypothetical protein
LRGLIAAAGIAGALAFAGAPAFAQSNCAALCTVQCVKPISIPDRWDDATGIPGYMGGLVGGKLTPNWRNNGRWDSEALVGDVNGNGLYDPGDAYEDRNGNGIYDSELYDPATTGYRPAVDLGLELTLKGSFSSSAFPGQYQVVDFPPVNRGTPLTGGEPYAENWNGCAGAVGPGDRCQLEPGSLSGPTNQLMRDVIARDPGAYWDPNTQSVEGSLFAQSPRIVFIPVHDPRIPITSANLVVRVTRIVAFFMEQMEGSGEVRGRFLRAIGSGDACVGGGDGFVVECPTPAHATSWGRVKDLYR